MQNYLKIGKATEIEDQKDRRLYRALEILPGFLSVGSILFLLILSYVEPVWAAFIIIAFNIYYLLLVIFLAIYLIAGFRDLNRNKKIDWRAKCLELPVSDERAGVENLETLPLCRRGFSWEDIINVVILPTYNEDLIIVQTAMQSLIDDGYPLDKIIVVLAVEERAGLEALERAKKIEAEFGKQFRNFIFVIHPDGIPGELKGKGANQAFAGKVVKEKIIDKEGVDYGRILVSVFDIDTVLVPGYFYRLAHAFLTVPNPYHASYQPVPLYHNNIWQAPFFARVASSSNTFWQIMQQIRPEKLSTYSSHSMTFKALADIGFWSPNMVSEDSRIFFNCLLFYNGDYRVEPLHYPVLMDTTMDINLKHTAKTLYKQQRRWAWGCENVPYLIFNTAKRWKDVNRRDMMRHILVQVYGFHSWATTAIIIGGVGWMPMLLGGNRFNATVLSGNLPAVTSWLMNLAMIGLIQSAVIANLLLPRNTKRVTIGKRLLIIVEWLFVPVSIIIFGAIPCLDAQIRLMFGKYMGFFVTPKKRE
ncbi:MAG: glycosyltransferase family 2 protein [Candidatus Falkowbacteria bacterium]